MSKEPKVIAEYRAYRILEDGLLEYWYQGEWGSHPHGLEIERFAALLADAVRQLRDEQDDCYNTTQKQIKALCKRIEAVSSDAHGMVQTTNGRVGELRDRVAAVEKRVTKVGSVAGANATRIRELTDSVKALESGESDGIEDRVGLANLVVALQDRVEALESRQQDEAGEGEKEKEAPDWMRPVDPCRDRAAQCHDEGYALGCDEGRARGRIEGREAAAREIVHGMRTLAGTEGAPGKHGYRWADWIEREFGGGVESEAP